MQSTVLTLFGAALALGTAELLLPAEKGGTAKAFRFLISLILLVTVLSPFLSFFQNAQELFTSELTPQEPGLEKYEQIFAQAVNAQSKEDLKEGVYTMLEQDHGIARGNATVLIYLDADGALVKIAIYLHGAALMKDPLALADTLRQKLSCDVEVR